MKLPTDYVILEPLEMTKDQYLRYKELVFKEDPIRFYNGMEIKISTPDATKTGDGSV